MSELRTFEQWFESEKQNGLIDIKLAISTKNAASREVQKELVELESMVEAGLLLGELSVQGKPVSEGAKKIICSCLYK